MFASPRPLARTALVVLGLGLHCAPAGAVQPPNAAPDGPEEPLDGEQEFFPAKAKRSLSV